jgi:hypothetical protein
VICRRHVRRHSTQLHPGAIPPRVAGGLQAARHAPPLQLQHRRVGDADWPRPSRPAPLVHPPLVVDTLNVLPHIGGMDVLGMSIRLELA